MSLYFENLFIFKNMDGIIGLAALDDSDQSDDDVDEAFILHILHDEENLGNRAALYGRFILNNVFETECKSSFRFYKNDIFRLARALGIPDVIVANNELTVSGIDGLCIVLRRLAYPNRLIDLEPIFSMSAAAISNIFNCMLTIIYDNKGHLLENLGNVHFFNYAKVMEYSQAITRKGCPLQNCWGFIDGTVRQICRPTVNQQNYYSGHKKTHCVKFQSVICPDGIIVSLKGAYEGRRHDAGIFRESRLYEELEQNVVFPNQGHFVLYGDQAYGLRELLLCPYTANQIAGNLERQNFNTAMSVLRISVEWGFSKIIQERAFLDFKKNQKLLLQEVGTMYLVATLLTNCYTCLYKGETSSYFEVDPPTLEEYLGEND